MTLITGDGLAINNSIKKVLKKSFLEYFKNFFYRIGEEEL
jgi:hypothetical protein